MKDSSVFTTDDQAVIDEIDRHLADYDTWSKAVVAAGEQLGRPMLTWAGAKIAGPSAADGPLPGWSKSTRRDWLVPARGNAGDDARAIIDRINELSPGRLEERLAQFGLPSHIVGGGYWWHWGLDANAGDRYYLCITTEALHWTVRDGRHARTETPWDGTGTPFIPVKLSDYYRAVEEAEAARP